MSILLFHAISCDTCFTAADWNQETSLGHSAGGMLSGYVAESTPLTGYEPKTCSFNFENDLTTTVAASWYVPALGN